MDKLTGIILAGGKSSRMGSDKGLLPFKGQSLIEYLVAEMKPFVENIIIVSNNLEGYDFLKGQDIQVIGDTIPGLGPLGGLTTGLELSTNQWNFVLSCDLPFFKGEIIGFMNYSVQSKKEASCLVPKAEGFFEPLCALYHKRTLKFLKSQIVVRNLSLQQALKNKEIQVEEIEKEVLQEKFGQFVFLNMNTPGVYDKIVRGDFKSE